MSRKRKRPGSKAGKREEKERREESANGLRGPPLCIIKSRDDVAECEVPCRRCVEKAGGGGGGIPRAREHSEKCTPSFPSLRFARSQGHPSPKSFNRTPRGIPGINRKHLLVSSTGGPREISTEGRFKGGESTGRNFSFEGA